MRDALDGDVPDRGGPAVGAQRVDVLLGVLGRGALLGDHQDVRARPLGHRVREVLAGDLLAGAVAAGEPDLDLVPGPGALDLGAVLVEPVVVLAAVDVTALPGLEVLVVRAPAVDPVVELLVLQRLAGRDGDLLVLAAGRVGGGEGVDGEVGRAQADGGRGPVGVRGALADGEGEGDVLGELRLDELLVVREVEAGGAVLGLPPVVRVGRRGGLAGGHLGREHHDAVDVGGVAVGLAVGGVELGGHLRVVAGDGRVLGGAGEGLVGDVVGGGGGHLPAHAVEDQLGGGVVVDGVVEADALLEGVEGGGLGFGGGPGAAVGLAGLVGRGALVVVAPLEGEVAVEVDAVAGGDPAVAVVVAQVLAPQALAVGGVRVVVAVGVGAEQEPQLAGVHQLRDPLVLAVVVERVVHQPPGHLGGDPLAGVLVGHVEHGGLVAVLGLLRVLADLQGEDVLALDGLADGDDLGERRVLLGRAQDLLLEPARTAVRAEHAVAGGLGPGQALGRDPVLGEPDALGGELTGLGCGEEELDPGGPGLRGPLAELVGVLARGEDERHLFPGDVGVVDPHLLGAGRGAGRGGAGPGLGGRGQGGECGSDDECACGEDDSRAVTHVPPWASAATKGSDARLKTGPCSCQWGIPQRGPHE